MSKREVLLTISMISIVLIILGFLLLGGSLSGLGLVIGAWGAGMGLVAWIWGIVDAIHSRLWGWLVLVIVLGSLGTAVYALFGMQASMSRHDISQGVSIDIEFIPYYSSWGPLAGSGNAGGWDISTFVSA